MIEDQYSYNPLAQKHRENQKKFIKIVILIPIIVIILWAFFCGLAFMLE